MNIRLFLSATLCLLTMLPGGAAGQQLPVWPRNPATGRIELTGLILWPTPSPTPGQQQALVRRWYATKLTSEKPAQPSRRAATFAGLPNRTYLDSVQYEPNNAGVIDSLHDRVIWRLGYSVQLMPTAAGLAYRLWDFEAAEIGSDATNGDALEMILTSHAPSQAVFYRRLRRALASW